MIETKTTEEIEKERTEHNEKILQIPPGLTKEEKTTYKEIIDLLKKSIRYKLTEIDAELIWQFCQMKVMRDRAWKEYNKNPERYIRIVTGICNDGATPKVNQ